MQKANLVFCSGQAVPNGKAVSKTSMCLQKDSNLRTPKRADLQSAAIAAMRYRQIPILMGSSDNVFQLPST